MNGGRREGYNCKKWGGEARKYDSYVDNLWLFSGIPGLHIYPNKVRLLMHQKLLHKIFYPLSFS